MTKRIVPPMLLALTLIACLGAPRMLSRPVTVQAGGLDCVNATLVELGYTIADGDRATGFIRGERQQPRGLISFNQDTDILMVSETTSEGSERQLNVTASRWRVTTQAVLDENVQAVGTQRSGDEIGPSDEGLADAAQLLGRCAGASGGAS